MAESPNGRAVENRPAQATPPTPLIAQKIDVAPTIAARLRRAVSECNGATRMAMAVIANAQAQIAQAQKEVHDVVSLALVADGKDREMPDAYDINVSDTENTFTLTPKAVPPSHEHPTP